VCGSDPATDQPANRGGFRHLLARERTNNNDCEPVIPYGLGKPVSLRLAEAVAPKRREEGVVPDRCEGGPIGKPYLT